MSSDLAANSFDGAANATQNAIDMPSDLAANSFYGIVIQLQMKSVCLLI
jgi:hypothetical protein